MTIKVYKSIEMEFPKGSKVKASKEGISKHVITRWKVSREAIVVGYSDDKTCVRILWDGFSATDTFHRDFLVRVDKK